jgi:spore coat polysaccharide biosynthesis protein SpsF
LGNLTNRLKVRYACWDDAELLFRWANDPTVRKNSFNQDPISMDDHIEWYREKLDSLKTLFFIIENGKEPVAQIRYERDENDTAEINFSVDRNHRGKGFGIRTLELTGKLACDELNIKYIKGFVISSNETSRRVFLKAGFTDVGQTEVAGKICRIFLKECSGWGGLLG